MPPKHPTEPVVLTPRAISSTPEEGYAKGEGGNIAWKTLVSRPKPKTDTFTTGIVTCAKSGGHLKCHRHTQAEIYHVTQGRGVVSIDGAEHQVEKGSVVFIRAWDLEYG